MTDKILFYFPNLLNRGQQLRLYVNVGVELYVTYIRDGIIYSINYLL